MIVRTPTSSWSVRKVEALSSRETGVPLRRGPGGGGPEEKDGGLAGPKETRTASEMWQDAQVKESTGDRAQSFARLQYYQEAMLLYQSLADHYPRARRALDALSPGVREVLQLVYWHALHPAEVAHVIGVSSRTVKNDWRVAKMWLIRELEHGSAS